MSKALVVLLELKDCSDYWSEYFVPIGIHERIDEAIQELLAQPEHKEEPFAVVANNSVGFDVSRSPQGMPLVWLGKLEYGDKLYRVRARDE